jgi:hypothetical protein
LISTNESMPFRLILYIYDMKIALFIAGFLAITLLGSCHYQKTYYHSKHGRVRHARAARYEPWYNSGNRGYGKHARRTMRNWDRGYHD